MLCPICHVELRISDRQGVEIDFCPQCRGVWLDRGELDKIIERTANLDLRPRRDSDRSDDDDDDDFKRSSDLRKRKRGSFLSELFDFD